MEEVHVLPEIQERKSIANWSDRLIREEHWDCLIEAARRAPSSWNHQPARYIILNDKAAIKQVCQAMHRTNFWAEKATALVVQVAAPEDDDQVEGKDYYLYDCGLAMMSMVYQAQALGMTTRQMIGWDEVAVKEILLIPQRYRVVVIAGMGFPAESKISQIAADFKRNLTHQQKRFERKHLVFWKAWGREE
jgi:nitroreductase